MRHEVWKWIRLTNLTLIKNSSLKQTIRRMIPLPALLACVATVTVTAQPARAQAAPVTGTWKVVASPNGGKQAAGNILLATAALSTTDAWAVGAEPHQSQFLTATLAEHWDGTQWSIIPTPLISTPTAQLNSIAVINSSDIWAAGYSDDPNCLCGKTVVEQWNGSSWQAVPGPTLGTTNRVFGVAASSSSNVWAVGEFSSGGALQALALHCC